MRTTAYKIFTHDLRSPIQGGEPVWDGALPYTLPSVEVDTSNVECGAGWNGCRTPEDALQLGGLWPDGQPSRLFCMETDKPVFERGNKLRSSTWDVVNEITDVRPHVRNLTERCFPGSPHIDAITDEQMEWRLALSRPNKDEDAVIMGLQAAVSARGVDWILEKYSSAWDAWAAWAALSVYCAGIHGWTTQRDPMRLTTGIRDAYHNGLWIAVPTGNKILGWAMVP